MECNKSAGGVALWRAMTGDWQGAPPARSVAKRRRNTLPRVTLETVSNPLCADRFEKLASKAFYSSIGRPSVDPEQMVRMLLVGYCLGIRSERRLCEGVHLNLTYRRFCRLDLEGEVAEHSTFSKNRHGRFRKSDIFRQKRTVQNTLDFQTAEKGTTGSRSPVALSLVGDGRCCSVRMTTYPRS